MEFIVRATFSIVVITFLTSLIEAKIINPAQNVKIDGKDIHGKDEEKVKGPEKGKVLSTMMVLMYKIQIYLLSNEFRLFAIEFPYYFSCRYMLRE